MKTEVRDNWTIVLEYDAEGKGPYLVDLSHRPRWDVQDSNLSALQPWGLSVPEAHNHCLLENGILINRMNRTQAAVWQLAGDPLEPPAEPAYTETTDVTVFLALVGPNVLAITEKLTALDLTDPSKQAPYLLQGPFSHVPCQLAVLQKEDASAAVVFTCSRGYARDMVHAVLDAGREFGLHPGGESTFVKYLNTLTEAQ